MIAEAFLIGCVIGSLLTFIGLLLMASSNVDPDEWK